MTEATNEVWWNTQRKIVVCGAGGTGIPALIGLLSRWKDDEALTIDVVDPDVVEESNLNRQILFYKEDLGNPKAPLLVKRLQELFPLPNVILHPLEERVTPENVARIFASAHIVLDTTDSVAAKLLLNDYCVTTRITLCSTGVLGDAGYVLVVPPRGDHAGGCLRCLFDTFEDEDFRSQERSCASGGIFGPAAGLVGLLAANAILEELTSLKETKREGERATLSRVSLDHPTPRQVFVRPSSDCPLGCSERALVALDLTDLECPSTYLYTKLALERLSRGETLDVRFRRAESAHRVARTCEELGYEVASPSREIASELWRLLLRRPWRV